jgi:hypothetical protein
VIAWPAASNPPDAENWLECNGQSTAGYPALAAIVGANVPNYQGIFLRGHGSQTHTQNNGSMVGYTGTTHSSGSLGAVQGDAVRNIHGYITFHGESSGTGWFASGESGVLAHTNYGNGNVFEDPGWGGWLAKGIEINASRMVPTANENRPANVAVRYLIRAK